MDPLLAVFLLLLALVALLLLVTSAGGRTTLLTLVGLTAAFDQLQVASVHLATVCALLLVAFPTTRPLTERTQRRLGVLGSGVVLLASTVLWGDLTNSPLIGGQMLLLLATGVLVCLKCEADEVDRVLRGLWAGCLVGCVVALLQYLEVLDPAYFADSAGIDRVHGLYREPDFLAFFASLGLVVAFRTIRNRFWQLTSAGLFAFITLVSFARASYVGLVVATAIVVLSYAVTRRPEAPARRPPTWLVVTVGAAGVVTLVVDGRLRETLVQRSLDAVASNSGDVGIRARRGQLDALLGLADSAPWYGWGLSAAGRVQDLGVVVLGGQSANNVATNWVLDWWIGGKLLAVPIILFLVWLSFAARATVAGHLLLVTVITSLFTNAMVLPITFVLVGLCLRELDRTTPRRRRATPPPRPRPSEVVAP